MTLPMLTIFGIGTATNYFVGSKQFTIQEAGFSSCVTALGLATVTGLAICVLWFFDLLGAGGRALSSFDVALILIGAMFQGINVILPRLFLAVNEYGLFNTSSLILRITTALGMATLVVVFHLGYRAALIWQVFAWGVINIGSYYILHVKHGLTFSFSVAFMKKAVPYGLSSWIGESVNTRNIRLEQYFLSGYATVGTIGLYGEALKIAEVLNNVGNSIGIVAFNNLAAAPDDKSRRMVLLQALAKSIKWSTLGALAMAIGGWFCIPILYGKAYTETANLMVMLLPGLFAYNQITVMARVLQASNKGWLASLLSVAGIAFSLITYYIFIPQYGAVGAAITTSITTIIIALVMFIITLAQYRHVTTV